MPAIFLSYAHEDTDAARRIAEAVRERGLEVWFDQNELRGGDLWDAKIRKQIKACTLFVPVISVHTNARAEGYFRLEWLLAVERSRLMADDAPFIVPAVVNVMDESAARVPEKFREAQWTRVIDDRGAADFAVQVERLIRGDAIPATSVRRMPADRPLASGRRRFGAWATAAVAIFAVIFGVVLYFRPASSTTGAGTMRFNPPRPVLVGPESDDWPAFSPDGKQLAFARDAGGFAQIFLLKLDGVSAPEQLTHGNFDHLQPAWSPDGAMLVYTRARAENPKLKPSDVWGGYLNSSQTDVWVCELAKARHELLLPHADGPRFSRTGELAYVSDAGGKPRIWICDRTGNQRRPVTEDPDAVLHLEPTWSPDGTKIAFRRQTEKVTAKLAIVDLATHRIEDLTRELVMSDPVWSPSGNYIYFTANLSSGFNLWRQRIDGSLRAIGQLEPVTFGSGRDLHAAFDATGHRLLFSILSWNSDIWAMPVDAATGKPAEAPFPLIVSSREDTRGAWSADSRKIVFTSDRNGDMNLFVCEFDPQKRSVTPPLQITSGPGGHYQASWHPSGRQIVYFSRQSGYENIWLVELDEHLHPAGAPRQMTHSHGADNNPIFSPDGKHIAFMSSRTGVNRLYVMNADGSEERQLMDQPVSGHYLRWLDATTLLANVPGKGLWTVPLDGREPAQRGALGGAHISLSPDQRLVADTDHTNLLMYPLATDASAKTKVFAFPEPDVGMDYTVWSPDGRSILLDRSNPQGADIYEIRDPESSR